MNVRIPITILRKRRFLQYLTLKIMTILKKIFLQNF